MALIQQVVDGQFVESSSQASLAASSASGSNGMDKEAFLQLLVAQMKYQDPLQPTSNTEYISQYAQFSQVESLQNMSASMDLQRASAMVGQEVYVQTTGKNGEDTLIQGKVEYVVFENGKPYLAINESLYSLDDLYTISDKDYLAAYDKGTEWVTKLNKLPSVHNIGIVSDGDTIDELKATYDSMNDYEKTFIASEKVTALNEYVAKLDELRKLAKENAENNAEENGNPGDTDGAGEENES
ncbi:MAG: hypothetical protein IJ282_08685 [Lachnospiraceae bacterium]|nr:hypothetical protein [Lachnospiraceae bacterium]